MSQGLTDRVKRHGLLLAISTSLILRFSALMFVHHTSWYAGLSVGFGATAACTAMGQYFRFDPDLRQALLLQQREEARLVDPEEKRPLSRDYDMLCSQPDTYKLPGYTVILAILFRFFGKARYIYAQVFTLILDGVLGVYFTHRLGSHFGKRAGAASALLYATHPGLIRLSVAPLPDSLVSLFVLAILFLCVRWTYQRRDLYMLLAGTLTGLAAYLRPDVVTLPLFLGLATWIVTLSHKRAVRFVAVQLALWLVILLPWGIWNYHHTGHFQLTRPTGGIIFWEGLGEYPNPCGIVCKDEAAAAKVASLGAEYGTEEAESILIKDGLDCIRQHPLFFLSTVVRRVPRTIVAKGFTMSLIPVKGVPSYAEFRSSQRGGLAAYLASYPLPFFLRVFDWVYTLAFYSAALLGFLYALRTERKYAILLIAPVLSRSIPFLFLHVEPRWIIVGQGSLAVLGGLAVGRIWSLAKSRKRDGDEK